MTLTWREFKELSEAIGGLTNCLNDFSLKDELRHEKVRKAAEIYLELLNNSVFAEFLQDLRKACLKGEKLLIRQTSVTTVSNK